jgi:hypothetical protein
MEFINEQQKQRFERMRDKYNQSSHISQQYWRIPYVYAERFADMCERLIKDGKSFSEVALDVSYEVDEPGRFAISFIQFCTAMLILNDVWTLGPTLRQWHNERWSRGGILCVEQEGVLCPCFPITEIGQIAIGAAYIDFKKDDIGLFTSAVNRVTKEIGAPVRRVS